MYKRQSLKELIVEDDASIHTDSLSDEERRPQLVQNALRAGSKRLTDEERSAADRIFE